MNTSVPVTLVSKYYTDRVKCAESTENISQIFVEIACSVHAKVLGIDYCKKILLTLDDLPDRRNTTSGGGHPFDSIYKLQALVRMAKTPEKIAWVVTYIFDQFLCKALSSFSLDGLSGRNGPWKNCGTIDVALYKRMVFDHLMATQPALMWWSPEHADIPRIILEVLATHEGYRSKVGWPRAARSSGAALVMDTGRLDLTWRAGWPLSGEALWNLAEICTFGTPSQTKNK